MTLYYIDAAVGSDANAGTAVGAGNAWATIGKALSTLVAGDIGYVKSSANYVHTSAATCANSGDGTSGPITLEGYQTTPGSLGTAPTITSATNGVSLIALNGQTGWVFSNLAFTHTAGTRGAGIAATAGDSSKIVVRRSTFDGCKAAIYGANLEGPEFAIRSLLMDNCDIKNCNLSGVRIAQPASTLQEHILIDCRIHDNAGAAVDGIHTEDGSLTLKLIRCVFYGNGRHGVKNENSSNARATWLIAESCVFHSNGGDGLLVGVPSSSLGSMLGLENCVFWNNGGYGVNLPANNGVLLVVNRTNAYGSNTSGARNNLAAGIADVTLTGDPATNAASNLFAPNNTAGAGAALRSAGFPGTVLSGEVGYADIGTLRHQDPAGGAGGGSLVNGGLVR
jgi:hypothetical protein